MNITSVAIVAIICWAIVEMANGRKVKSKDKKLDTAEKENFERQISELNERIATLERIVTDEKYTLNREIEALNRSSVA